MNIAAVLYLIATIIFALLTFGVQVGDVPMLAAGLMFAAAGLFVSASAWNHTVGDGR